MTNGNGMSTLKTKELPRIGVLGGMGPLASAVFMVQLVESTPAAFDREHFQHTLDSSPQIPDRPTAIAGNGPDPLEEIIQAIRRLEGAGASLIVMPCNTVHHWYEGIAASTSLPVIHIADAVATCIRSEIPSAKRVGVLGSTVTSKHLIYEKRLGTEWDWVFATDDELAEAVMPGIAAVKAGNLVLGRQHFLNAVAKMIQRKVDVVVFACTEIPIVVKPEDVSVPTIDSSLALARHTVKIAGEMRQQ